MDLHNLFIHSRVDGHLDCLQFLAVTDKVAVFTQQQALVWTYISFPLGKYLGVGPYVQLFKIETAKLFFKVILFYIPTRSMRVPILLDLHQPLVWAVFLILAI